MYNCDKCNKEFIKKSQLRRHLNKKFSCITKCQRCNKTFKYHSQLEKHLNRKFKCDESKLEDLSDNITENKTIINNTINNINNGIVININTAGNENLDYLLEDPKYYNLFNTLMNKGYLGLRKYFKEIHCNPEHKENSNIKCTSLSSDYCKVFTSDKKWKVMPRNQIMKHVLEQYPKRLIKSYNVICETFNKKPQQDSINNFWKKINNNKKVFKDISKLILSDLYNYCEEQYNNKNKIQLIDFINSLKNDDKIDELFKIIVKEIDG